uniref:SRPBCC domain-containing protein n=1 Tax=Brevundimonas nasdae TaxID=172043 RepID=UPI0028A2A404
LTLLMAFGAAALALPAGVPQAGDLNFVRIDTFEAEAGGTRYTSVARHWEEKAMETHKAMGFVQGWGAVADQLAELAEQADR